MRIEWDEVKRQANIAKHAMDFADLDEAFFHRAAKWPSVIGRVVAIGRLKGVVVLAVVYRPYGNEAVSVISMRAASLRERRKYHDESQRS